MKKIIRKASPGKILLNKVPSFSQRIKAFPSLSGISGVFVLSISPINQRKIFLVSGKALLSLSLHPCYKSLSSLRLKNIEN
ncbi:hypothetical protein [Syntrophus gentianae]|uniref:hypothetical protein n=1 Tax=Syntrophus gentianae TaxID=43775 RepID=UPI00111407A3|nr:hypothetical protein [Syntrophus gentianae]